MSNAWRCCDVPLVPGKLELTARHIDLVAFSVQQPTRPARQIDLTASGVHAEESGRCHDAIASGGVDATSSGEAWTRSAVTADESSR